MICGFKYPHTWWDSWQQTSLSQSTVHDILTSELCWDVYFTKAHIHCELCVYIYIFYILLIVHIILYILLIFFCLVTFMSQLAMVTSEGLGLCAILKQRTADIKLFSHINNNNNNIFILFYLFLLLENSSIKWLSKMTWYIINIFVNILIVMPLLYSMSVVGCLL